jgi:hypothetical protein
VKYLFKGIAMSVLSFPDTEPAQQSYVKPYDSEHVNGFVFEGKVRRDSVHAPYSSPEPRDRNDEMDNGHLTPKPLNLKSNRDIEIENMKTMISNLSKTVSQLAINKNPDKSELTPNDSSSVIERYEEKRKYWKPDYNLPEEVVMSKDERDLEEITSLGYKTRDENTVIRGFVKTRPMIFREMRTTQNIQTIKGLQRIFVNDRLNFLAHLHNALHKLDKDSHKYPPDNFLYLLQRVCRKPCDTPQKELLKMVIETTIDFDTMEVVANQFRIPILETGMMLTEQYIYMAFDKLNHEYEMEWFETTKDLHVPSFHSKFKDKSDTFLSMGKLQSSRYPRRSGTVLSVQSSRNTKPGSKLSFF